jgi:outer membrane protein assembly factor BamB
MEEEAAPDRRCEAVVCLDAATGHPFWRFRYPSLYEERFGSGPRSTPAVDGDRVYSLGPTGILHCLRADTGEKLWRHDLIAEFHSRPFRYGMSSSPLVDGEFVYTMPGGPDGNSLAAFDKRSGQLKWKAADDPVGYSSPVAVTAAGVRQILFLTNIGLVSFTPAGKLLWRYPWEAPGGFNIATPLPLGNYVFISSAYDKGCALVEITRSSDGAVAAHRVYEHNRMRNYFASSVLWEEHIYGFDLTDLVCMNIRTGEVVWREKGARSFRKGSLLIADGQFIILGEAGTLTLAEATPLGYRPSATVQICQHKCWTVPSLAGGKLYVRDESQIVCLNLRPDIARPLATLIPSRSPAPAGISQARR